MPLPEGAIATAEIRSPAATLTRTEDPVEGTTRSQTAPLVRVRNTSLSPSSNSSKYRPPLVTLLGLMASGGEKLAVPLTLMPWPTTLLQVNPPSVEMSGCRARGSANCQVRYRTVGVPGREPGTG